MTGETKRINPAKITNITASFNASESAIPDNVQNDMLDAPARENFETATNLVKTAMTNLTTTVQSLDQYLDAVAHAFQNTDETIAATINQSSGSNIQPIGDKMYVQGTKEPEKQVLQKDVKNSQYYEQLPGAQ